jgi:hypothetical protein
MSEPSKMSTASETIDDKFDDVDNMTVAQKIRNFPRYVKHQIISLKPPGEIPMNPITCLRMLNRRQWAFWFVGFLGWTWVRLNPS